MRLFVQKIIRKCGKFVVVRCKSCGSEDGSAFCSEYRKAVLVLGLNCFYEWKTNGTVEVPVLDAGGALKGYADLSIDL